MAEGYKLCPKCNNALDNNVMQCPYCGENLWVNFWYNEYSQNTKILTGQAKNSSKWCLILFMIFFVLPFIWSIISFMFGIISSFFD
jgi:uncharacterized membrane protein YvbJ